MGARKPSPQLHRVSLAGVGATPNHSPLPAHSPQHPRPDLCPILLGQEDTLSPRKAFLVKLRHEGASWRIG